MMKKINLGSPSKENPITSSPNRKKKIDSFYEIAAFIKNSGIHLPSHISKIVNSSFCQESPLKQVTVSNREYNQGDSKKIKIQLTDCQFQLKKIEEDFADFKRNTKLQKQRENKRFEQTLNKLKSGIQFANENGAYTVDKVKREAEQQLKTVKEKHQLELQQEVGKLNQKYRSKLQNQQKLRARQINELINSSESKYNQKVKDYQELIQKLNKRYTQQLKDLSLKHKLVIEQKEKRYQSNFLAIQSQKKTQQKLHQKTKLQYSKERQKIISDLCFQRNINKQLEEEIEAKDKEIKLLKIQIKDSQVSLILKEQKHKKKIQQIQSNYQNKYQQLKKESQAHLKVMAQNYRTDIQKLQKRINNFEIIHQQKEELLLSNIEELSLHFHKRPSKPEDVSEMDKLKWALTKKEEENKKLKQELKHTNLELQNKEDIYTRIFRANSMSREKKGHLKDERCFIKEQKEQAFLDQKLGKQTLFRKSQTADIKFLLKVYNNNKNG